MGVYIKGMEMPKTCFECYWRCKVDPENLLCRISGDYFEETFSTIKGRHNSCPLVPVPAHGRLIDADELDADILNEAEAFGFAVYECGITDGLGLARSCIEEAPTIIPAEEGET